MRAVSTVLVILTCVSLTLAGSVAVAGTVKMPEAPAIKLEGVSPLPLTVGLLLPDELRSQIEVVKTSPFDKLKFAVGAFTAELLEKNLPALFTKVVPMTKKETSDAGAVDLVVTVEIVRFEVNIPRPAYNPYTASAVYRLVVTDPDGETVFTQTATGQGQTSKGMMSGFKARSLAAEAAKLAMVDAATQALEGTVTSGELRSLAEANTGGEQ